ncbi:MAG TPA: trypsin-like peptidase domain-containing protein [Nocardioidaceae bacterium]|nr:trypsin-like peptidase domain-containing protein [Nocardioidaceae bacterium]
MSENEPGRPESDDEDTAPLWARGDDEASTHEPAPGAAQGGSTPPEPLGRRAPEDGAAQSPEWVGQGGSYYQPQVQQDPYGYPQQDPYGWQGNDYTDLNQYGYAQQPYGSDNGWGYPTQQQPPQVSTQRPSGGSALAGWVWPVIAATAMVVGLLGGAAGGALVSASLDGGGRVVPVIGSDDPVPAPLKPRNGSVAAVADALLPSTVQILTRGGSGPAGSATGSGFVVDREGHVITNNHVVSGVSDSGEIQVVDHEGRRLTAEIVGRSPVYDIAVLDVEGAEDLKPAALGSSRAMKVGETVVAIGSPLGLSSTVTAGIVSALDRPVTTGDQDESSFINAVQTDAAINPGNSGGPLVNLRGEVVGVNSAIATMGGFAADAGNIGVGFAIPMEQVKVTASQIVENGEAEYPVIGANVNTGSRRNGAQIVDVPSGTPADQAGLKKGDIVIAVEEKPVADGIGLIVAIRSHQPGETIRLTVRRQGQERTLQITLDAKVG